MKLTDKLDEANRKAREYVLDTYNRSEGYCKEDAEFLRLAKALLDTELSHWGVVDVPQWLETWEGIQALFVVLNHSITDDGFHAYISCDRHGPTLMSHIPDSMEDEEIFMAQYGRLYNNQSALYDLPDYEVHYDTDRFIKELEERPTTKKKRWDECYD